MMALIKGPGGGCLRGRPLYDGSQPSKYAGAAKRGYFSSTSAQVATVFFDLAGGHGLRVDNLHHVAAHVLETLAKRHSLRSCPRSSVPSSTRCISAAASSGSILGMNEVERRVGLELDRKDPMMIFQTRTHISPIIFAKVHSGYSLSYLHFQCSHQDLIAAARASLAFFLAPGPPWFAVNPSMPSSRTPSRWRPRKGT